MSDLKQDPPTGPQQASSGPRRVEFRKKPISGPASKVRDESDKIRQKLAHDKSDTLLIDDSEPHVIDALKAASRLRHGEPIDARMALLGALSVTRSGGGLSAFERLGTLLSRVELPKADESLDLGTVTGFTFTGPLLENLERAHQHPPEESSRMWGRDLVTAALLATGDPSLLTLADEASVPLPALQDAWLGFVRPGDNRRNTEQWLNWWKAAGVPLPEQRSVRAGYFTESVTGKDQIGIAHEVAAFAGLIADANTTPPLSIALLGDWGSGKSFFMEKLQEQVKSLSDRRVAGLCKNVAQIRFNAWHYSDTRLWPSLVGHIFDELWASVSPLKGVAKTGETAEAREQRESREEREAQGALKREIERARGAIFEAESQMERTRGELEVAEQQREELLDAMAIERFVAQKTQEVLDAAAEAVGWNQPLDAIVQLKQSIITLKGSTSEFRSTLDVAVRGKALRAAIPWVAGTLGVALITTLAAGALEQDWVKQSIQSFTALGGIVGTIVAAIGAPIVKAGSLMRDFKKKLDKTTEEYESTRKKAETDVDRSEEARVAAVAAAEFEDNETRVRVARQRLVELEKKEADLDPARRLTAFLEERASSGDYRSKQGVISLVRRDFRTLAHRMRSWARAEAEPPAGLRPVDRIVLYLDDLDRCLPQLVVRTLEAVHLLLALDLFVVVVEVDSRWLLRSLEVEYKELLGTGREEHDAYRRTTPQNYLEKIFQITFAVAPMGKRGFGRYVDFLTGKKTDGPSERGGSNQRVRSSDAARSGDRDLSSDRGHTETQPTAGTPEPIDRKQTEEPPPVPDPTDLIRALTIGKHERAFLARLYPLVPTPRLAKRLVNVFRLVKATVPGLELAAFEDKDGAHRPTLLLLAIVYGYPATAVDIFRNLCEERLEEKNAPLHEALGELSNESDDALRQEWERLVETVKTIATDVTVKECEQEAPKLARYSLATGPDWHTWRRPEPEDQKSVGINIYDHEERSTS